ncbi:MULTISPECIES: hypothetical protein [unclassified Micromonospora]|uniref:hypothetical protein n=1 Tax=unclassified Micromonospora TaxID=2617518 RepID=UPI001C2335B5|nr:MULTISPECIES: hypothetical protein [unclassified Micromonospora]MBU8857374.1 hypothetical protein [Micromonospora sp. WMMB482]MDM4782998.1 hypothetical protein [Micromonospora sp. b486]
MRGDLDETLARMARREEALRRRAPMPGEPADRDVPAEAVDEHGDGRAGHGAYRLRGGEAPVRRDPVEEVAEAVRRVVAEHPGLAVTLRVELGEQAYPLRVSWSGSAVTVGPATPAPPPAWPMSVKTVPAPGHDPLESDPAARLAEMIRRDPSLLDDPGPR